MRCLARAAVWAIAVLAAASMPAEAGILDFFGSGYSSFDDKAHTAWIFQIDTRAKYPKPFEVDPKLLAPYAKARLGPQIAYSIMTKTDFVRAPEAQKYCQDIVDRLLAAWKGPVPRVQVLMTGDPSYGAAANQTGNIFVHIGTFDHDKGFQNEDELALILAHEISHLLLPHLKNQRTMKELVDDLSTAATLYVTASLYSNTHMAGRQIQVQADNDMFMKGVVAGLATTALVGDVLEPSWGSSEEGEADMLGLDLARRAGYAVTDDEVRAFIERHGESVAAHSARLQKLKAVCTLLLLAAKTTSGNTGNNQFDGLLDMGLKLGGAAAIDKLTAGLEQMSVDHPDRQKREDALLAYYDLVYGEAEANRQVQHGTQGAVLKDRPQMRSMVVSAQTAKLVGDTLIDQQAAKMPQAAAAQSGSVQAGPVTVAKPQMSAQSQQVMTASAPVSAPAPAIMLPSPCASVAVAPAKAPRRGKGKAAVAVAPPPAAQRINTEFPVDDAPFTWRVRGDWQNVDAGCRPRAPQDWARSARSDYASADALRSLTMTLVGTPGAALLPPIYDRYKDLIGTDVDFPELAIAVSLTRNDVAGAETKAAECFDHDHHRMYPLCAQVLGYNPLDKTSGGARTPEGRKAFAKAGASLDDLTGGIGGLFSADGR